MRRAGDHVVPGHTGSLPTTHMCEISYETYCKFGALRNRQLSRRDLYGANGKFVKTRYYCSLDGGVLTYPT